MEDTEWLYTGTIEYSPIGFGGNWYGKVTKAGHLLGSVRSYTRWLVWLWMKWAVLSDRWYEFRADKNRAKGGKEFKL